MPEEKPKKFVILQRGVPVTSYLYSLGTFNCSVQSGNVVAYEFTQDDLVMFNRAGFGVSFLEMEAFLDHLVLHGTGELEHMAYETYVEILIPNF